MSTLPTAATAVDQRPADRLICPKAGADQFCMVHDRPDYVGSTRRSVPNISISPQPTCTHYASVRIYRPSPNAMQAGRANTKRWLLEFEPRFAPFIEPLMGWTGSTDTLPQVRLTFATKEQAIAFAERQGWSYAVSEPHLSRIQPKSYADNFRGWPATSPASQLQRSGGADDSVPQRRDPRPHRLAPPSTAAQQGGPVHHRKSSQAATAAGT
jgi:hypothetical protein